MWKTQSGFLRLLAWDIFNGHRLIISKYVSLFVLLTETSLNIKQCGTCHVLMHIDGILMVLTDRNVNCNLSFTVTLHT